MVTRIGVFACWTCVGAYDFAPFIFSSRSAFLSFVALSMANHIGHMKIRENRGHRNPKTVLIAVYVASSIAVLFKRSAIEKVSSRLLLQLTINNPATKVSQGGRGV